MNKATIFKGGLPRFVQRTAAANLRRHARSYLGGMPLSSITIRIISFVLMGCRAPALVCAIIFRTVSTSSALPALHFLGPPRLDKVSTRLSTFPRRPEGMAVRGYGQVCSRTGPCSSANAPELNSIDLRLAGLAGPRGALMLGGPAVKTNK